MKKYIIKDKHLLASYIFYKLQNPSLLKVQLTMYFLYGYYGGFYYKRYRKAKRKMRELPMLFKSAFEAGEKGPYDKDIEKAYKEGLYDPYISKTEHIDLRYVLGNPPYRTDSIESLINDFIKKADNAPEIKLTERALKDRCWIKPYENPKSKRIYPRRIEKEYAKKI